MKKPLLIVAAFVVALGAAALSMADTLVVTDEERLERFVDELTSPSTDARLDVALNNADPSRVPVDLVAEDLAQRFADGDHEAFAETTRKAFAPLLGEKAELVEKSIAIDGDHALVAVRVATDGGLVNARFRFVRCEDGWLVDQMSVL
jgi:NAD(P)-dependent dehydrogenase (short-subunit alcohol dehydrogenase family)